MSLDGLRAWIGEVERKLGMRSRVFLVLVAIAIGGAGAGIYLALDAGDEAASEDEVQRLQEQIEGLDAGATSGADPRVSQLELELKALQGQVESLQSESETAPDGGTPGGGAGGAAGGAGAGSSGSADDPQQGAAAGAGAAKLKEFGEDTGDQAK